MSFESHSRECQLRLHCLYSNPESLKKVKELVETGVNVHARGSDGLNALMRAALGYDLAPNTEAFYYLYHQRDQPFSLEEKVDGLELLGASYILNKDFSNGLRHWIFACGLRSTPKPCNVSALPQLYFVKPEWQTMGDLIDLLSGELGNDNYEVNMVHQAMLVRLRLLGSEKGDHVNTLCGYAFQYLAKEDYSRFLIFGQFCLDWTEVHGGSFSSAVIYLLKRMIFLLSVASSREPLVCTFYTNMAILKWIASQSMKLEEEKVKDANMLRCEEFFIECVVQLVVLLSAMPKTDEKELRLRTCLQDLVNSDFWVSKGLDILKAACCPFSKFFEWHLLPTLEYSPLPSEEVAKLLVEMSANPNDASVS